MLLHMCFVMRVCWFVCSSLVANLWYDVIENRLSNSKLRYVFLVPYFWLLSFAWDPSVSFQSHFFVAVIILSTHSYLGFVSVGCYCYQFLFVGMVQQTLRKLGRCQMTQLI